MRLRGISQVFFIRFEISEVLFNDISNFMIQYLSIFFYFLFHLLRTLNSIHFCSFKTKSDRRNYQQVRKKSTFSYPVFFLNIDVFRLKNKFNFNKQVICNMGIPNDFPRLNLLQDLRRNEGDKLIKLESKKLQNIKNQLRGMEIEDKYSDLRLHLQKITQTNPNDSIDSMGFYYFKELSHLSIDIILQENEINELKSKIQFMKSKLPLMEAKFAQKKKKQEQKRYIHCEMEGCSQTFGIRKELHYHKLFKHENQNLFTNMTFSFKVQQENKE